MPTYESSRAGYVAIEAKSGLVSLGLMTQDRVDAVFAP